MINRRKFIRQTGALTAMACVGKGLLHSCSTPQKYDLAIINGTDYFNSAVKAVNTLGGMPRFVTPGAKVGVLINSGFDVAGAYVNPDISLAVIKMIIDAGASEVTLLQSVKEDYWKRSPLFDEYEEMIQSLHQIESNTHPATFNDKDWRVIETIDGAVALKDAEVVKKALEVDVFVNIPISKHHMSTLLTNAMKNVMGICTRKTNVTFHLGSGTRNDPDYLAQCISDINLLRKTNLCIVDATEFITTGGPGGPGDIKKIDKVLAGTDIIALDAICSEFIGYAPEDILSTVKGQEAGTGSMSTELLSIAEVMA